MRISVTGWKGRLGAELLRQGCAPLNIDQDEANITDPAELRTALEMNPTDVLINCAAVTNVDGCATVEGFNKALQVNTFGVDKLLCAFSGRIIHISTDYVFDGKTGPYNEKQAYNAPINDYGWSKYGGEIVLLSAHRPGDLLVRTTGLYGRGEQHDFVSMVRSKLSAGDEICVSKELRGNQTYVPHLASALIYLSNQPSLTDGIEVLNIASREVVSRYEFALMVASCFRLDKKLIRPVLNKDVPGWVAKRPSKGGLKVKLAEKLGVPIYSIRDGLEALYGNHSPA